MSGPTIDTALATLLPLLRCPVCLSGRGLSIRRGRIDADVTFALLDSHLGCLACDERFPVTDDHIPILWDEEMKSVLTGREHRGNAAVDVLHANKTIYDAISDDYSACSHRHPHLARKMVNAVHRVLQQGAAARRDESRRPVHLDFGCGPGHVIEWLSALDYVHIGLDISLANLRNARRNTGCLVVCGSACNMPFRDESVDLVTESSVLHHILEWQRAVKESLRICRRTGGVVVDSEPTTYGMAISRLAVMVYDARMRPYQLLSYLRKDRYGFRNLEQARLNERAEVHHQPGGGLSVAEMESLLRGAGFDVDIVLSPSPDLMPVATPNWKEVLLSLLSARNPWDPRYGQFVAMGRGRAAG